MRKKIFIICILVIAIGAFGYITAKTELTIWSLWDTTASTYELEDGEVLYTATYFDKKGLAPIRIKNIQFVEPTKMTETGADGYLFYIERVKTGYIPAGFGIEPRSFFYGFGENMIPKEEVKWINEDFEIIEIKDSNEVTETYCKVTYAVWGIFEKKVVGTSREK